MAFFKFNLQRPDGGPLAKAIADMPSKCHDNADLVRPLQLEYAVCKKRQVHSK